MTGLISRGKALLAVALSATILAVSAPAMAQEVPPEQLELARKYIDLTDRSAIYETTLVEIAIGTMRQIVQQNPEITEQTNTAISKILEEYKGRKGELLDQFARVYALSFTQEELQQIVDFYSTPTGIKLAKSNAAMSGTINRIMDVFAGNLNTEFFTAVRAELRAKGIDS